ncbi:MULTISPECIES: hypothetical protein [Acinetobacter]|jgi:hypothetical protein|uniref:Peptide signal n=2 Tax=Acinetobacter TaxID=469 RepID=A0A4Q7B5G4_9GAMM|nr:MULTISPECIES: hypothetical protein [Acinetobacter]MCW8038548.1 hypothetical protein [Acinetobacter entericus]RZG68463.1 hypothetical protein EXE25_05290 [Acinetobacter bouvetii]TCB72537.1 hypothetical protein E0H91_15060 [Acinetobacter sp. ANC 4177]
MNLPKPLSYTVLALAGAVSVSAFAAESPQEHQEAVRLPVLTVMAEPELREETGVVPYQQETARRKALQHRVMQIEEGTQSFVVDPSIVANLDILPAEPSPNLSSLPPALQQHVLNIASGLQSSDPRNGLYIMLQPFGINRDAANVQISREQINLGTIDRSMLEGLPRK